MSKGTAHSQVCWRGQRAQGPQRKGPGARGEAWCSAPGSSSVRVAMEVVVAGLTPSDDRSLIILMVFCVWRGRGFRGLGEWGRSKRGGEG